MKTYTIIKGFLPLAFYQLSFPDVRKMPMDRINKIMDTYKAWLEDLS